MEAFLLIGIAIAAIGVGAMVYGRRRSGAARRIRRSWTRSHGRVVAMQTHQRAGWTQNDDNQPWYHPVVEYTLPDGSPIRAESATGAKPAPAKVGDDIALYYDPAAPEEMMVDAGLASPGMTGTGFVVIGVGMVVVGALAVGMWALIVLVFKIPV